MTIRMFYCKFTNEGDNPMDNHFVDNTYNRVEGDNRLSPDLQDVYARSTTPDNRKRVDILLSTYRDYFVVFYETRHSKLLVNRIEFWNQITRI